MTRRMLTPSEKLFELQVCQLELIKLLANEIKLKNKMRVNLIIFGIAVFINLATCLGLLLNPEPNYSFARIMFVFFGCFSILIIKWYKKASFDYFNLLHLINGTQKDIENLESKINQLSDRTYPTSASAPID